jgi:predicted nucleotidyltransferase
MAVDIEDAKRYLNRRREKEAKELRSRMEKAREDFSAITAMIIRKYQPKRIYQWGSLLTGNHFSEISDIDIGVEGIKSAEEFFSLYGDADEMTNFPVDIVEIDKIEPEFRDQIITSGKIIYEQS